MINLDLTLTETVAETLVFTVLDSSGSPAPVHGSTWNAILRRNDTGETILLPTQHGANPGEILVDTPSLAAGSAEWELWRNSDHSSEIFLKGSVTIFSSLQVETLALNRSDQRAFAVRTNVSGAAYQVHALPGNASLACLDKIAEAYQASISMRRIQVDSLPDILAADSRTIYFVGGTPWVAVSGNWLMLDAAYAPAVPNTPGLMTVPNEVFPPDAVGGTSPPSPGWVLRKGDYFAVKPATIPASGESAGSSGVISLSTDFDSHSEKNGLTVYRADLYRPGLVSVQPDPLEDKPQNGYTVYTVAAAIKKMEEIAKKTASSDKLDTNLSNLAEGIDVVMQYSYDPLTGSWWRLYKSGWIEQGGVISMSASKMNLIFPKEMADTNYCLTINQASTTTAVTSHGHEIRDTRTTTGLDIHADKGYNVYWTLRGMSKPAIDNA